MRLGIISDVHGNAHALQEVLSHLEALSVDHIACLGDTVGYGPSPMECIGLVRERCRVSVRGNHDLAVASDSSAFGFNPVAAKAIRWTRARTDDEARSWLRDLPTQVEHEGVLLCHGAPSDPDHYILGSYAAGPEFSHFAERVAFHGHTHVPAVYALQPTDGSPVLRTLDPTDGIEIAAGWRYLVNPGSVGQPRDADSRAAFMVMDTERGWVSLHRVVYPVAEVQRLMRAAGLPRPLIERLGSGV